MSSTFSRSSVFVCPRVHAKKAFSKVQLWRAFSKSSVLIDRFHRIHVDVSRIRKAKVAFSNENGFVWTGLSSPFYRETERDLGMRL